MYAAIFLLHFIRARAKFTFLFLNIILYKIYMYNIY